MIPSTVYRIQLQKKMPFEKAAKILPYLKQMGIQGVYLSPIMKARSESSHNYDVVDPNEIDPKIGGEEGFSYFVRECKKHHLFILADWVANHMAASLENPWWVHVLEMGKHSNYARIFDIAWKGPRKHLQNRIMLPVLDEPQADAIKHGKIQLRIEQNLPCFTLFGQNYPLNPYSYRHLLATALQNDPIKHVLKLCDQMIRETDNPDKNKAHELRFAIREAFKTVIHDKAIDSRITQINQNNSLLEKILSEQFYVFDYWQSAFANINYRRFFDINDLVAVRIEDPNVFTLFHKKLIQLLEEKKIDGLRIDHPDGLFDPKHYFLKLRELEPKLILVEKILEREEPLRKDWPVDGTVGYEHLNLLNGLFINKETHGKLLQCYEQFIGKRLDPKKQLFEQKKHFSLHYLSSELDAMVAKDCPKKISPHEFRLCLSELFASFPVYRTYLTATDRHPLDLDLRFINQAFANFNQLASTKDSDSARYLKECFEDLSKRKELILRFQQICPPITAKGLEDTHLYTYFPLLSINEVGGMPTHFFTSIAEFHEKNRIRLQFWPQSMFTFATHDTKRSFECKMRINALSELTEEWIDLVKELDRSVADLKIDIGETFVPDQNRWYFILQTLIGFYSLEENVKEQKERLQAYALKASREAKEWTNWIDHNDNYERALHTFIDALFEKPEHVFWQLLEPFIKKVENIGYAKTLSAMTLALAGPGIADIYQGTEVLDLSLVDPDNRREVIFSERQEIFSKVIHAKNLPTHFSERKFVFLSRLLKMRVQYSNLFLEGEYEPLDVGESFVGFIRSNANFHCLVVAQRFFSEQENEQVFELPDKLKGRHWKDEISNRLFHFEEKINPAKILEKQEAVCLLMQ